MAKEKSNQTEDVITVHVDKEGGLKKALSGYDCKDVRKLEITGTIGDDDFKYIRENLSDLAEITLPDGITEIGKRALDSCLNLTKIIIPDSVTSIGDYAFRRCEKLESIVIPNSVKRLGEGVFCFCHGLKSVKIPNKISSFSESLFFGCSKLTEVNIPKNVASIGYAAFYNCSSLKDIVLPDKLKSMGDSAFNGCSELTSIEIPSNVTSIDADAFSNCGNLKVIRCKAVIPPQTSYAAFTFLPDAKIYVPATSLDVYRATEGWSKFRKQLTGYDYEQDKVAETAGETLKSKEEVTVYIGYRRSLRGALHRHICSDIRKLKIIGYYDPEQDFDYICQDLVNLEELILSEGMTTTGDSVLYPSSLKKLTLPESATFIGCEFFRCTTGLTDVYCKATVPPARGKEEEYVYPISEVSPNAKIHVPTAAVEAYKNSPYWAGDSKIIEGYDFPAEEEDNEVEVTVHVGKEGGLEEALSGYDLEEINKLKVAGTLGEADFDYIRETLKYGLTEITLPRGLTAIPDRALTECNNLRSTIIPNSVTTVGAMTFQRSGIKSVVIGNGVTSIGSCAFRFCSKLTSVTFGNNISFIGSEAFFACDPRSIDIPESVTEIKNSAFYNCKKLTEIYCRPTTPPKLGEKVFKTINTRHIEIIIENAKIYVPEASVEAYKTAESWAEYSDIIEGFDFSKLPAAVIPPDNDEDDIPAGVTVPDGIMKAKVEAIAEKAGDAAEDDVITVNIKKGGLEEALIAHKGSINKLKITGTIGTKDYKYIQESLYRCLEEITLPDGLTSIMKKAFYECAGLVRVKIPDSVTEIGDYAFGSCKNLTDVNIPDGVTRIGYGVFYNCINLANIKIPDGVTEIGEAAFNLCRNLAEITIPNSVTSIGSRAFLCCRELAKANIPDGITSIEGSTFSECNALADIDIPDSVTKIGWYAFDECKTLASVTIPANVTEIGNAAFRYCSALTEIYCKATTPPSLGNEAFMIKDPDTDEMTINKNTKIYVPKASLEAYKFAKGWSDYSEIIRSIESKETGEDDSIEDVGAGYDLITVHVDEEGGLEKALSGYIIGKISKLCITGTIGKEDYEYIRKELNNLTEITLPDGLTEIREDAFYNCNKLASVIIPDGVTKIGSDAFSGCVELIDVRIPDSVTEIGSYAFSRCEKLTNIRIPDSVTCIWWNVFEKCTSLTSVNIPEGVQKIESSCFSYCNSLTGITIPNSVTSIGIAAFYYCTSLTSVRIPDSVTEIEHEAFSRCESLTEINIPDGITSIEPSTFDGCEKLESINIPDSVTEIGEWAFSGCEELKSIKIPDSVTSLKKQAFRNCKSLQSVILPERLKSIEEGTFYGCEKLDSLIIPNKVTAIKNEAFRNCSGLTSITFSDKITSIGDSAFTDCAKLESVTLPNKIRTIGGIAFLRCEKLEKIYCKCETPPEIGISVFDETALTAKIYVPKSSVEAYKTAKNWSKCSDIIEGYDF